MPLLFFYISYCFLLMPSKKTLISSPLQTEPQHNFMATLNSTYNLVSYICTTTTTISFHYRVSYSPSQVTFHLSNFDLFGHKEFVARVC